MKKYVALALLGLALAGGAARARAEGCCVKTPKQCVPILRIPPEDYAYGAAIFIPPNKPVPYSVWYYAFYQSFCSGKPADQCIWACGKPPPLRGAALRVGG